MNKASSRPTIFLGLLLLLSFVPPSAAEEELPFDVFVVPPEPISGLDIRWVDLVGAAAAAPTMIRRHGPFHGDLSPTPEGMYYSARPSLWQVKIDSFILDYHLDRERHAINVVIVVGKPHKGNTVDNSFDEPVTGDPGWLIHDPAQALLVLSSNLWVAGAANEDSYVYALTDDLKLRFPPADVYDGTDVHAGSSTTGTGGGVLLIPPPVRPTDGLTIVPDTEAGQVFYAAGPTNLADSVKGWFRWSTEGLQARVEAADELRVWYRSPWVDLPTERPVRLEVEVDTTEDAPEVARLKIDGVLAASTPELEAGGVSHALEEQEHRIGVMQPPASGFLDLRADDAEIYRYRIHGEEEPHQADDFEDGGNAGWTGSSGNGLTLTERGPVGKSWLQGDLASGNSFLIDSTPEAALWARLRFDLDTASLTGSVVKTLAVHSADTLTSASEHLQVLVRPNGHGSMVQVSVKGDVWHFTGWQPLPEAEVNRVELTFRVASAPGTADGELHVWLDGVELPAITGLANDQNRLEALRFGAMNVAAASTGQIYLDNFQLWVPHALEP